MEVYKSKISWIIYLPIVASFIPLIVIMIVEDIWLLGFLLILVIAFILYIFLKTKYTVTGNTLRVQCGFLYNEKIKISSIRQIKETNNPISSPALSLDRLEIKFENYGSVLISPKEKVAFIEHLQHINPAIEFIAKKK